jgi:bifunctional DNA-binding transcriptional regulator/antitoxin component of YhaV-PrlF toxin-antitoxin module
MQKKIVRKIDELGRVIIPRDVALELRLNAADDVEISAEENFAVLRRVEKNEREEKN